MDASRDVLSLADALQRWCDECLLQRVRDEECRHTEYEMDNCGRIQLTSRAVRRKPSRQDWMVGSNFTQLSAAWVELEHDLRRRIEQGQIHIRGVQLAPDRRIEPEIIPGGWAADFLFDFRKGTIKAGPVRFGAIECSQVPWISAMATVDPVAAPTPAPLSTAAWVRTLRPEDLPDLDDETVLALLNEHARRVIKNGGQLIAPGKVSLMPIISGKMKARAESGELQPTLTAESQYLATWIKGVASLYQVPTAPTIKKVLSNSYGLLKARSTRAIQHLNI